MSEMKAYAVNEYKALGDLSAVQEFTVPKPSAKGKDILVRVKAVATNPIDYKMLGNLGNEGEFTAKDPLVVGWDAAGIVEEVGDETSLYKVGDEVMFAGDLFRPGAFAEFVLVDERIVGKKPSNLSYSQAAAIPLTILTAWESLVDKLKISENVKDNEGKVILVTGGAGGVATAAVELAKKVLGLKVIATGSREESINYVKGLGADHIINHREPLTKQINDLGFKEVDYILHCVDLTPELFTEFVDLTKAFGGICSIWPQATVDLFQLFWKSISFSAELMFTRPKLANEDSKRQYEILNSVADLVEKNLLTSHEVRKTPMNVANLRAALELQASGKAVGKSTLTFEA